VGYFWETQDAIFGGSFDRQTGTVLFLFCTELESVARPNGPKKSDRHTID
jgi:hypothetical protein